VIEVREVLRAWLAGVGLRTVAKQAGVDRKTARRYVEAAESAGVVRERGLAQLSDELVGAVVAAVRPTRPGGRGPAWERLVPLREEITSWVRQGLTVVKVEALLARRGVVVPYRTLHRFCVAECGFTGRVLNDARREDVG
jgi:DNA-binding IclR family transcriptional regulator